MAMFKMKGSLVLAILEHYSENVAPLLNKTKEEVRSEVLAIEADFIQKHEQRLKDTSNPD